MGAGNPWTIDEGGGPVVACAIHAGSDVRAEVLRHMAVRRRQRFYEEDPYTDQLTAVAGTTVVVHRSRFEVDLNRERERAVYRTPGDAWGLPVWRDPLPPGVRQRSLRLYDRFFAELAAVLARAGAGGRPFVVLDLHSYNHRRGGPGAPPADPAANPEINLGTASVDRERWGALVDRFAADLRTVDVAGRPLDVRENVRFRGGHLSRWVHATFPGQGCCLAIEVKKFFMDEHTGIVDEPVWAAVHEALAATVPGVLDELAAGPPARHEPPPFAVLIAVRSTCRERHRRPGSLTMAISRSRRLTAAVFAAAGAFTLLGTAGAVAAPAPPAGPVRAAHQPESGIAPLCVVMPQTQGCENGPIQK